MHEPGAWLWTTKQRRALAVIVLFASGCFLFRAYFNRMSVADPPPPLAPRAAELATRIDPNTADWPAFAALPTIGEKRAQQIVAFRDQWQADHPGEIAFQKLEDLTRIKGIGKETIKTLEPFLAFPLAPDEPVTQP